MAQTIGAAALLFTRPGGRSMPASFVADSDQLQFIEEESAPEEALPAETWRVLIVDDDKDVHAATELALRHVPILGRRLEFLHAYSAKEAQKLLRHEADIAVVLLDVVMEQHDAGLKLVHFIRHEAGLSETRIVLRTGQPGYAPEIEAIRDYDINDYWIKAELTRSKLYTTLTVAIRSYFQLRALESNRLGMEAIVRAGNELMGEQRLPQFAAKALGLLCRFAGAGSVGFVCAVRMPNEQEPALLTMLAASGRFAIVSGEPLTTAEDEPIRVMLAAALRDQCHVFSEQGCVLYLGSQSEHQVAVYLERAGALGDTERQLLEVLSSNLSARLDNLDLFSRLHDFAFRDPLLGLPNRRAFIAALDEALVQKPRRDAVVAILGIDHFGDINVALGPRFGDELLGAVAQRLARVFGPDTLVARVSGDTFGLIGPDALIQPDSISELFSTPIRVGSNDVNVTVSTGLLRFSEAAGTGNEAFMEAAMAAKQAKSGSRSGCVYYARAMEAHTRQRVTLHQKLHAAFDQNRLMLHYQPQVELASGRPVGYEALLRWKEDDQFIPPSQFIPLVESSGLIIPLGLWVLRRACSEQVRLAAAGYPELRMAVNVSMAQLRHPLFLEWLDEAVADTGIVADKLELEITESMAMLEPQTLVRLLQEIDARGIKVAIDDFGTGFSSLSYLQQFRVHRLKIDQSFVARLSGGRDGDSSIAELIVQLGHKLGLQLIAEGVEKAEQANSLLALGCHEAQGYYYARPMDIEALQAWLAKSR
jgi:diguanylate cyclase (GGDEF)-like protein